MTEKQFEGQVLAWASARGIWLNVYDSKAKMTRHGFYQPQGLQVGTPDLLGVNPQGKYIAIELKRPGHPVALSLDQYRFLRRVIQLNAFAVCSNQLSSLESVYDSWVKSPCQNYLIEQLPKKVYFGKPRRFLQLEHSKFQL